MGKVIKKRELKITKPTHDIGRKAIGGFPGHEHVHPTGEQFCFGCGLSLEKIIKDRIVNCSGIESKWVTLKRKGKPTKKQVDNLIKLLKKEN